MLAVFLKIKICVNLSPTSRFGRSTYWKLNTSILEDEDFFTSFKLLWADISKKESSYIDVAEWWDKFAKAEIKPKVSLRKLSTFNEVVIQNKRAQPIVRAVTNTWILYTALDLDKIEQLKFNNPEIV